MNRGDIRQAALDLESWHADVDTAFLTRVNNAIDRIYKRVAGEVPEALLPDTETLTIFKDQTHSSLGRTIANTDDDYVLSFGDAALAGASAIVVDGTWDGIMHLEIEYGGEVIRRRCREFWEHKVAGPYLDHYLVSLDRPINFSGQSGLTFRLFQPNFYTKDSVTKIVDGRLFDSNRRLLSALPAGFVRFMNAEDYRGQSLGPPQAMTRGRREQLPSPNRTPTISSAAVTNWVDGQEAPGSFKYRYTYVWGKRATEQQSPRGSYDPMWESAPSPASAAATVASVGADAVVVNMVNVAWQVDFDPNPTTTRSGRSGLRKRIYRARLTVTPGGSTESAVEFPGVYFFLAEVGDDDTTFTDDGSYIPEYDRRLPESHGYWAWSFAPHQDETYEMDLRVLRRPELLQTDYDVPNIDPQYEHLMVLLLRKELASITGDEPLAQAREAEYLSALGQYRQGAANSSSYTPATPWFPEARYPEFFYGPYKNNP